MEALMSKRGIHTEIPDIKASDFYPELAKVGKGLWVSQKVANAGCSGGLQIDQPSLSPRGLPMGLSLIGHAAAEIAQLFCEAGGGLSGFARMSSGTTLSTRAHCHVTASV
jgi:hypothetical protein